MCDYNYILNGIKNLKLSAPDLVKVRSAGKSTFGRDIHAVTVGTGEPCALIFGAIHAREHITAALVLSLAQNYLEEIRADDKQTSIVFVPMVNPDGVELCVHGLRSAPQTSRQYLKALNQSEDFSNWKANGNGVDLNVNFSADWGTGKTNVFAPAPQNYVGPRPMSEPETRAIASEAANVDFALAYHSKGDVVYYGYSRGAQADRGMYEGKILADSLAYTLEKSVGSAGGFKDWFLLTNRGVAFTIEVGSDELNHPISDVYLPNLIEKHRIVPKLALSLEKQYGRKIYASGTSNRA